MKIIDLRQIVECRNIKAMNYLPHIVKEIFFNLMNRLIHSDEINHFVNNNHDKFNFEFIDELFNYLNFSYNMPSLDKQNIPSEGKLIIVANHPLGALDGLALLKAISEVRKDVKIVANDILLNLENIKDLFLPYNVFSFSAQKNNIENIEKAIQDDCAIIFFPAASVSRLSSKGIRDGKWTKGALRFAKKFNAPILPVFIRGRNSIGFYATSLINKKLSMLMLAHEIFNKRNKSINLRVGNIIPTASLNNSINNESLQVKLLKKHTYKFHKMDNEIYKTEKTIIHPIEARVIKNELINSKLLAVSKDEKKVYLCEFHTAKNVIKEIARLREITFRKVGEGTGEKFDFDKYDKYYKHVVLWDDKSLEIVGSYRIGICSEIIREYGVSGLYNSEEFAFNSEYSDFIDQSLELGRSFIQQKYWRSNALDLLWQGIASLISDYPNIQYLFGAVSISNSYSETAKNMIVFFYNKWYGSGQQIIKAKNRYSLTKNQNAEMAEILKFSSVDDDFKVLKSNLKNMGFSVPVMFKRYTDLCQASGVKFLDFNIDKNFSNCIDGMLILEIEKMKQSYKDRYCFAYPILTDSKMGVDTEGNLIDCYIDA